jgi:hypothetical protein
VKAAFTEKVVMSKEVSKAYTKKESRLYRRGGFEYAFQIGSDGN